jgi:hypothetical protein
MVWYSFDPNSYLDYGSTNHLLGIISVIGFQIFRLMMFLLLDITAPTTYDTSNERETSKQSAWLV